MPDFVRILLRKSEAALTEIEGIYARDVASRSLSEDLLYAVRGVVQDCQWALDATATRVKETPETFQTEALLSPGHRPCRLRHKDRAAVAGTVHFGARDCRRV